MISLPSSETSFTIEWLRRAEVTVADQDDRFQDDRFQDDRFQDDRFQELGSQEDRLQRLVHPLDWVNPVPRARYHLVVIGAGTAGLVAAAGAAGLGAKVALVEQHRMGGDCLNYGCVPSKAYLSSARTAALCRESSAWGVQTAEPRVDFSSVQQRMRSVRQSLAQPDSADRFQRMGVDLFFGEAAFEAVNVLRVGETRLRFGKAVICTGSRPLLPAIPGLVQAGPLTNRTIFDLPELPRSLAVIGGGPVGCELAQGIREVWHARHPVCQIATALAARR